MRRKNAQNFERWGHRCADYGIGPTQQNMESRNLSILETSIANILDSDVN